jgi:hypothetical protein
MEGSPRSAFWTIEGIGGVFPASRLRRIERAQDVLTHVEESVYDVLWGVKDHSRDWTRQTAMGYEEIARKARASTRGVVDIIQRLIQKGFLAITHEPITFGQRRPTEYRVFSYAAVREHQRAHNRVWTIRTGNGIGYAQPLQLAGLPASTIEPAPASTVEAGKPSTVDSAKHATVETQQPSTIEAASTCSYIDNKPSQNTTTATPVVAAAIHETMGRADEDAAVRIAHACRETSPDVTDEEIAHFIRQEAPALRRNRALENPMGVLIRHIPRCCRGESLRLHREAVQRDRERTRQRAEEWLQDARAILANPESSAMDRDWANGIVAAYADGAGKSH